jgi:hypothetical protein
LWRGALISWLPDGEKPFKISCKQNINIVFYDVLRQTSVFQPVLLACLQIFLRSAGIVLWPACALCAKAAACSQRAARCRTFFIFISSKASS